jgi:hypothetical protein
MENKIEFFVSVEKDHLGEAMKVILEDPDKGDVKNVMGDGDSIHLTVIGSWAVYQRVLRSHLFSSVEHFEDDAEAPKYWVSTATNGQQIDYNG